MNRWLIAALVSLVVAWGFSLLIPDEATAWTAPRIVVSIALVSAIVFLVLTLHNLIPNLFKKEVK